MERVYKEILPGRKLLKDASQFEKCKSGNTQGTKKTNMLSNITTTHQLSEESDADDDKPPVLDCRFCDVICNTKRALSIHEKTHKNVDNQVFPCNVIFLFFPYTKCLIYMHISRCVIELSLTNQHWLLIV